VLRLRRAYLRRRIALRPFRYGALEHQLSWQADVLDRYSDAEIDAGGGFRGEVEELVATLDG
jgi:hypothetical protein